MATAELTTTKNDRESLGDNVFQLGAMLGAVAGALAGVSLAGDVFDGTSAAVFGTTGTLLGSVACAVIGKYLLFPMWAAMIGCSASRRD